MSGTSNGQLANETTFNNAYIARNGDSNTIGKLDLQNNDPGISGPNVTNLQRNINQLASQLGVSPNDVYNALITWSSTVVGLSSSSSKDKIEALVLKFRDTLANGGHTHDGSDGEGPQISATDLANYNDFWAIAQQFTFNSASGLSIDVSANFVAKAPGGNSNTAGVITSAPDNFCHIIDASTGTFLEDAQGQKIYGRLTETGLVWTLTFYTNESGVETAHNLSSTNIKVLYREVFTSEFRPTIPADPAQFGTLDVTADVVDASQTQRGVVSILAQTFAGVKTFFNDLILNARLYFTTVADSTTTGASATMPMPSKSAVRVTNASLTSITGISGGTDGAYLIAINLTGGDVTLINETGTAANQISTGTGADFEWKNKAAIVLYYEGNSQKWYLAGGGGSSVQAFQETPTGTVNGTNDTFTLSTTPNSAEGVLVTVDGIVRPETEWSLVGNDIVFGASHIPQVGQNVYVYFSAGAGGGGGGGVTPATEYRTLTGGEITAKQLTLSGTPASPTNVLLDIIGGTAQEYSVDFTVSGTTLSWNGLGLDGLLTAGDKLRIHYYT